MGNEGEKWNQWQILFSWAPKPLWTVTAAMKFKRAPWKENYDKPRRRVKKQTYHFANKGPSSQNYGFSSSHVQCESWTIKRAEPRRFDAFELWCWRTPESPLGSREIQPVSPKENQPWIFIGRTDAEAPVLGYLMWRADSLEKTLMLGKTEGRRRRGWDREWNSWIASPTQWTRVWANFKDFVMDRKPSVLQSTGLQRFEQDLMTEQQQRPMLLSVYLLELLWCIPQILESCVSIFIHFEVLFIFDFFMDSFSFSVTCQSVSTCFFTHFLPAIEC